MIQHTSHNQDLIKLLEEQLGKDVDARIIREVAEHMEECPDCRVFVDSVKQTIKLYRVTEKETSIPDNVSERLFKVLNLNR